MEKIIYKCDAPSAFSQKEKEAVLAMLIRQRAAHLPTISRLDRCRLLSIAADSTGTISVGALKPAIVSNFSPEKSGHPELWNLFSWELDYFYTSPEHVRKGYATGVLNRIMESYKGNLSAITELGKNYAMVALLNRFGFIRQGKTWSHPVTGNQLSLFIRVNDLMT